MGPHSTLKPDRRTATPAQLRRMEQVGFVEEGPTETAVARFAVGGMTCSSCSAVVESSVGSLAGVSSVVVSLVLGSAEVCYVPGKVTTDQMLEAFEDVGFTAALQKEDPAKEMGPATVKLAVKGITCSSCEGIIVHALEDVATSVDVNIVTGLVRVTYVGGVPALRTILAELEDVGFAADVLPDADEGNPLVELRQREVSP